MRALNKLRSYQVLKKDKGVAGLNILLAVVTMLFVIGLMVMVFSLMGGELEDFSETKNSNLAFYPNQTFDNVTAVAFANTTVLALEDVTCSIFNVTNNTDTVVMTSGNYTQQGCYLLATDEAMAGSTDWDWNVTYTLSWSTDTTASGVIENSTSAIGTVVNWFPLFIVITAMVVLILLTVMIISAIRGSGLIGGGSVGGSRSAGSNFGSA